MLKAVSEIGTKGMTYVCNSVVRDYEIHVDCIIEAYGITMNHVGVLALFELNIPKNS